MKKIIFVIIMGFLCINADPVKIPERKGYVIAGMPIIKEPLLQAFIKVESNGDRWAWNKKENARGILQIRPIMLREINSMQSHKYNSRDCWNTEKSKQIWRIIMLKRCKTGTIKEAARIWNGKKASERYYKKLLKNLKY